jgi:hypothetical protein
MALLATLLCFAVGASFADSVTGFFNIDASFNPVAPVGQVTFTLNGDGTIGATLIDYGSSTILGFGFNSAAFNLPESNFTPTIPDNPFGWVDVFGTQPSGFLCSQCGLMESWTIGNPGDYTSVFQVLNGGSAQSFVDFFLLDEAGFQWGAHATPEPGSLLLLGSGVLGIAGIIRRKMIR